MIEVESEVELRNVLVDFSKLSVHAKRGLILTAPSDADDVDFVSRFFAPAAGIDEDPVTGSAHCCLTPFWAGRLQKNKLVGYQASERGGYVHVELCGDRVLLAGQTTLILAGSLMI